MDDYLDQYFASLSWSDVNFKERSPWVLSEPDQPNALLPSSPISMIGSNHGMECLATQSTPLGVGPQTNGESLGLQFNAGVHSSGSLKGLQVVGDMTTLSQSFNEGGNVLCNGGESSEFQRSLTGLETLCSIPQLWHPQPYDGLISSLPMGQTQMQSSSLQGDNGNVDDGNINRFVEIDKFLQLENLSASINAKEKQDMQNSCYSSFPADRPMTDMMIDLPSLLQSSSPAPNKGCNGTGKPQVRARRGQATDPHSIAERLRREKIAERMKNLQELVPNSNKTDKASMLDSIIEYVKFLQLQVKVLSMSRLGAAGAVVPLITDGQAEGSNGLTLTPLAMGSDGVDCSPSPEQVVFEQEVVKLMESNVTIAMQYLQSKGLCIMPIALAAAISNGKASSSSSSGPVSEERKKFGFTNSVISNDDRVHNTTTCSSSSDSGVRNSNSSNSSGTGNLSGVGIHQSTSDGNFMIEKINGCNGTFKQEVNTLCTAK
ncbi:hypothetical protein ES319_D07G017000v1 [Gossypium barbadense]|uniref:BHLH domain-containing protein n=3 Tax=Gossypium TaxID=3633 RepID=A0A5J5QL98_GOSBA|nr:transcription factor bHLH130 isoform X1 [Gossypium raimondii]XP_012483967.1 transcription factor bHLH130 isoform X1 [Gossypium raimondii]XP_012484101.1 transcription factor bHLH130 isoform X1 [Gossypium raimondii]XP_012484157.1 transcription factor bHLH130 isoform X1 [Gossypium raimondii]KAB2019728.1 hypothetical protein ES319_D07G017000v1 [Gossypium barbadense]TYG59837.1 hypothetical protein ES288_D07G018700v1 [Gossypium darwinii]KAB2019729.1 hypothetical protein ES319_D07G017000v1 [Gossy